MITQEVFLQNERGLMLFMRGMAKLADAPVVILVWKGTSTGSSPVAAHYIWGRQLTGS